MIWHRWGGTKIVVSAMAPMWHAPFIPSQWYNIARAGVELIKRQSTPHPRCSKFNVNSLAPGKFKWNFRHVIFKQILVINGWGISCEIALIWMSLDFTDDQSTSVQVMAWCRQATSHYLSQCWPTSLSPYGVTRPQWVKLIKDNPHLTLGVRCSMFRHYTYPL